MTDVINFEFDTTGDIEKRIMLPFLGFYDSEYVNRIYEKMDTLAEVYKLSGKQVRAILEKIDYNKHLKTIAVAYVDYLNQELNDMLSTSIKINQVDIHNRVLLDTMAENVSGVINVKELPSIDFIVDFCKKNNLLDFKKNLEVIADDKLLSKDQDITSILSTPYENWQNIHIECLVSALVQVIQVNKTGKESVNWLHDIVGFEHDGFIGYAEQENILDIEIDVNCD